MTFPTGLETSYDRGPYGALHRVLTPTVPAAGTNFRVTVPGGQVWFVRTLQFTYTTDATVVSRRPDIVFSDGNTEFFEIRETTTTGASSQRTRVFATDYYRHNSDSAAFIYWGIPKVLLLPGWFIESQITNWQAGDVINSIALAVDIWPQRGLGASQDALRAALRDLLREEFPDGF